MKFSVVYGIFVGVMILVQWIFFLASGKVPELQTEPWRIAMHLAAEFITAAGLIIAGWGLLQRKDWSANVYLVFAGMLVYSVIVSPGYFTQQGQWSQCLQYYLCWQSSACGLSLVCLKKTGV